jgi:hypothetical protein
MPPDDFPSKAAALGDELMAEPYRHSDPALADSEQLEAEADACDVRALALSLEALAAAVSIAVSDETTEEAEGEGDACPTPEERLEALAMLPDCADELRRVGRRCRDAAAVARFSTRRRLPTRRPLCSRPRVRAPRRRRRSCRGKPRESRAGPGDDGDGEPGDLDLRCRRDRRGWSA